MSMTVSNQLVYSKTWYMVEMGEASYWLDASWLHPSQPINCVMEGVNELIKPLRVARTAVCRYQLTEEVACKGAFTSR